ncbi:unnamed protein product [Choristocarpus tenellus]
MPVVRVYPRLFVTVSECWRNLTSISPCTSSRCYLSYAVEAVCSQDLVSFKERLRPLGSGRVALHMDDETGLAGLVLDHEDRRNALSGKMMSEFADAVDALEGWERGVALTLRGRGNKAFCAGADLSLAREHLKTNEDGQLMCALMTDTLTRLRRLPMISVAIIEGSAVGGGAELATSCDFRVAGPGAKIQFVQVKMGVSTGWGGGSRLVGILGRRQALRLLAWSSVVTAEEGLAMGLLDAVGEEGGNTEVLAAEFLDPVLCHAAYGAVRSVKSVVAAAADVSRDVQLMEKGAFSQLWGGKDNRKVLESEDKSKP